MGSGPGQGQEFPPPTTRGPRQQRQRPEQFFTGKDDTNEGQGQEIPPPTKQVQRQKRQRTNETRERTKDGDGFGQGQEHPPPADREPHQEHRRPDQMPTGHETGRKPPRRAKFTANERPLGPNEVYIGRGQPRWGLERSKWGNPFRLGQGRRDAISRYRYWVRHQPNLIKSLPSLTNMTLVCHCKPNEKCHGDVLIEEWHRLNRSEKGSANQVGERTRWAKGSWLWHFVNALRGKSEPLQDDLWWRLWPQEFAENTGPDLPNLGGNRLTNSRHLF